MMSCSKKMIVLMSSDKVIFEVAEEATLQSETLKHMIEDECADAVIPVPNVAADTLSKVLEYCNRQPAGDDQDFVKDLDLNTLFDLVLAANYLCIKRLLELTCRSIADRIKDYTPEKCREVFNTENDFTEEEEKAIRKEHEWAFQMQ